MKIWILTLNFKDQLKCQFCFIWNNLLIIAELFILVVKILFLFSWVGEEVENRGKSKPTVGSSAGRSAAIGAGDKGDALRCLALHQRLC